MLARQVRAVLVLTNSLNCAKSLAAKAAGFPSESSWQTLQLGGDAPTYCVSVYTTTDYILQVVYLARTTIEGLRFVTTWNEAGAIVYLYKHIVEERQEGVAEHFTPIETDFAVAGEGRSAAGEGRRASPLPEEKYSPPVPGIRWNNFVVGSTGYSHILELHYALSSMERSMLEAVVDRTSPSGGIS